MLGLMTENACYQELANAQQSAFQLAGITFVVGIFAGAFIQWALGLGAQVQQLQTGDRPIGIPR